MTSIGISFGEPPGCRRVPPVAKTMACQESDE